MPAAEILARARCRNTTAESDSQFELTATTERPDSARCHVRI